MPPAHPDRSQDTLVDRALLAADVTRFLVDWVWSTAAAARSGAAQRRR